MFSLFWSVLFLTFISCFFFFLFTILLSFSYSLACFCVRNAVNTDFTDKHMGLCHNDLKNIVKILLET